MTLRTASRITARELPDLPPWHHVSSRMLAEILNVSLQTIWNWRMRRQGPVPEPEDKFRGPKRWYAWASVLRWLDEIQGRTPRADWEYAADFLNRHLLPEREHTEESVARAIALLDRHKLFPRKGQPRLRARALRKNI